MAGANYKYEVLDETHDIDAPEDTKIVTNHPIGVPGNDTKNNESKQFPEKQKYKECQIMAAQSKKCQMTVKLKECRKHKNMMTKPHLPIWIDDTARDR